MSYMPAKEADFLDWSANPLAVSKANAGTWKLPQDRRGKRAYFAARCESGTVKKGPESAIFSAVFP
ncbi:MAG: hypothetical protein LBJ24_08455 [Treponema sp.]|jgi:hypothetical protein|nr:hypothetical protein [Treponema sp.]